MPIHYPRSNPGPCGPQSATCSGDECWTLAAGQVGTRPGSQSRARTSRRWTFQPACSPRLAHSARRADVRFVVHDLHEPLPFPERSFDVLVSALVLEHIRALEPFFTEMQRVLTPGGRALVSTLHPSMFLVGSQARFTDPESGAIVRPGSVDHPIGEIVMATIRAGLKLEAIEEHAPTLEFADRYIRAVKYVGRQMLLMLVMRAGQRT